MNESIDRTNKEDLLKQIGRTEEKIAQQNRAIAKIDREINNWSEREVNLKRTKERRQRYISDHHKYINQLEQNLNNL